MDPLHLAYAVVGLCGSVLALGSRRLRELPFTEPMVVMALGVLLGPYVLGTLELSTHQRDLLLLEGSRLLLAWSVMAAALRFPATGLRSLIRPVVLLLAVVMPVMALVAGGAAVLLGLPLALAFLLGACLSPTDPVLAASVISGEPAERDLPTRLRKLVTVESGANDGLALPLVGLTLAAVLPATGLWEAAGRLAWEVLGGTAIGLVAGAGAGWLMDLAVRRNLVSRGPELVFTLLLAVTTLGLARVAGTAGVLAVFVAGLAYNRVVGEGPRVAQEGIDEAVNRYAVLPLFLVLGLVLPWRQWWELGPMALIFVLVVLLARRLPVVFALARSLSLRPRDAAFFGWYGPMGVSALFYLAHAMHEGVEDPRLFAAGTLVVAVSVVVFGGTAMPGRRLYARSARRS